MNLLYRQEAIESTLTLLNQLSVKGIENCKRICLIEQILQNPEEGKGEKENGNCSEEK